MASGLISTINGELMDLRSYVNHVGNKRYYSSTDAIISFNGVKLEECQQIVWAINEPKQPLFGYNSYTFDEVAVGSRIVQGMFSINYIIPDYLNLVLKGARGSTDEKIVYKNTGKVNETDHHKKYFPGSFNIDIGFGKQDKIIGNMPHIFLEYVFISQAQQIIGQNGEPIYEVYNFIARDSSNSR